MKRKIIAIFTSLLMLLNFTGIFAENTDNLTVYRFEDTDQLTEKLGFLTQFRYDDAAAAEVADIENELPVKGNFEKFLSKIDGSNGLALPYFENSPLPLDTVVYDVDPDFAGELLPQYPIYLETYGELGLPWVNFDTTLFGSSKVKYTYYYDLTETPLHTQEYKSIQDIVVLDENAAYSRVLNIPINGEIFEILVTEVDIFTELYFVYDQLLVNFSFVMPSTSMPFDYDAVVDEIAADFIGNLTFDWYPFHTCPYYTDVKSIDFQIVSPLLPENPLEIQFSDETVLGYNVNVRVLDNVPKNTAFAEPGETIYSYDIFPMDDTVINITDFSTEPLAALTAEDNLKWAKITVTAFYGYSRTIDYKYVQIGCSKGDLNADGNFYTISDTMTIAKYVIGKTSRIDTFSADINTDGIVDILDFAIYKRELM